MLKLLLPLFFAFVIYQLKGQLPSWEELKEEVASIVSLFMGTSLPKGSNTSHVARSVDMESEFEVPWERWDPQTIENYVFDHPTLRTPSPRRYFGPMEMEVAGDQILIYDMDLGLFDHATAVIFQTVISIKPPELRLPAFVIRPKGISNGGVVSGEYVINSDSLSGAQFTLETLIPHRTKALFESELGTEVLIPFLHERKWTVQWTGSSLIVYRWNHLIDPKRLHEVALEVSEFFELLKSGPEVIDRKMEELIQETRKQTNTTSAIGIKRR